MNSNTESFANIFTNGPYNKLQQYSDATLKSKDGKIFNIHRMILAPKSEYFRAQFSFNNNSKEFSLKNIESHTLEQILIFLYTDQLSLNLELIPEILIAADFLLMDKLTSECTSFVIKNLDILHCLPILNVARYLNNKALFQHCYRFSQLYFQDIIENDAKNTGSLDMEVLKMLLSEKCLNISSEKIIWNAICTWINHDLAGRLKLVPEMLTYFNIKTMEEIIATDIITTAIVSKNEHCKAIKELKCLDMSSHNILKNHMLLQGRPIFPFDQARLPLFLNVVVRKRFKEQNIELLIIFDEKIDAYQKICDLDFFPRESLIMGNKLHLYLSYSNIFSWDLVENKRTTISPAFLSHFFENDEYSAVLSNGMTYCMNELYDDDNQLLSVTVECYNPEIDEWTLVAPMPAMNVDYVLSCCDEVYAFGYIFTRELNPDVRIMSNMRAQKYNPETDTWSLIALPSIERCGSIIACYNNKLLLIGGEIGEYPVPELIDKYDPATNSWSTMPKLPVSYHYPEIANVDGVLFIYEGHRVSKRDYIRPPVFWNEENRNWQIVTETASFYKLENFMFFTIHNPDTVKRIICNRRSQKWIQNSIFN